MAVVDVLAVVCTSVIAVLCSCVAIADFPSAVSVCSALLAKWRSRSSKEEAEEKEDREECLIRQRLAQYRCEYLRRIFHAGIYVQGIGSFLDLWRLLSGLVSDSDLGPAPGTGVREIVLAAGTISLVGTRMFPQVMNEDSLWIFHSYIMGTMVCFSTYLAMVVGVADFAMYQPVLQSTFVLLGMAYPETLAIFLWGAAWVVISCAAYLRAGAEGNQFPVVVSLASAVFQALVLRIINELQVSLVRNELESKGHLQAKVTAEKVLASMSDAVVELDQDLGIAHPCPKLAALLMRNTRGSSMLKGEDFPGLLCDDADRQHFADFITARMEPVEQEENPDGDTRVSSVYVNLRDSNGTPVAVQVFHSCHHQPPNGICHILGVRERQEEQGGLGMPEMRGQQQGDQAMPEVQGQEQGGLDMQEVGEQEQGDHAMPDVQAPEQGGLGMQEEQEQQRGDHGTQDAQEQGGDATNRRQGRIRSARARRDTVDDGTQSVASSAASSAASSVSVGTRRTSEDANVFLAPMIAEGSLPEPNCILFNPITMQVLACTQGFTSSAGPLVFKMHLRDLVTNYGNRFELWADLECNRRLANTQGLKKFELKFTPTRRRTRPRLDFHANAYVIHAFEQARISEFGLEIPAEHDDLHTHVCVMALKDVKPRWKRPKQKGVHPSTARTEGPLPQQYGITL